MNRLLKFRLLPLLPCLLLFASCSKKSSDPPPSNNPTTTLTSGNWIISSYTQRTENKTSQFNGYVFTFSAGGSVTATNNAATTSGTWSYIPSSVGYYGGTPTKSSLALNLGTATPLNRLTRTWNIDSVNSSATTLVLLNPEPLEGEQLKFSKQ